MRNLAKFNKELEVKYANYRQNFEAQQQLLDGPKEHFFQCIDRFPNLQLITLMTDQCEHLLSNRFTERYIEDCAVPMANGASHSPWQLQGMLRPGIKHLRASQLSLKFFDGTDGRSEEWLQSVLQDLDSLALQFHVTSEYETPQKTNYLYTIGCAKDLKELAINFSTSLPTCRLYEIFPEGQSFSKLHRLGLGSFTTTEEEVMTMLKLQPALKSLLFSDVTISIGEWRSLFKGLRTLNLDDLTVGGTLKDSTVELETSHYSAESWQARNGPPLSLSRAIELWVIYPLPEADGWGDPVEWFESGDYASYEDLEEEYGPPPDDNGIGSDDNVDDSDDETVDMEEQVELSDIETDDNVTTTSPMAID